MSMDEHKWNGKTPVVLVLITLMVAVLTCCSAKARDLEAEFRNPPHSTGVRCFWWWLNSNVTKEAISRDLDAMQKHGIGGASRFAALVVHPKNLVLLVITGLT